MTSPTFHNENPFKFPLGWLTCQICGKKCLATEGYIANHGHKKIKGENGAKGYITDGCAGSREKPYENNRDVIADEISYYERSRAHFVMLSENVPDDGGYSAHVAERQRIIHLRHAKNAASIRDMLQGRYDRWEQTITDEQWDYNRNEVVHPKRSGATVDGWETRRFSGFDAFEEVHRKPTEDRDAEHDAEREDRQPDRPTPHPMAYRMAILVEHGVEVAMFMVGHTGTIIESFPAVQGWVQIDSHDDLTTVPPTIRAQLEMAA